jgi:hypothetical protein
VRRVDGRLSVKRIGHKGADAIAPGNTLESFAAAVEIGVEMIELDVLRPRSDFADGRSWRREPAGPTDATGYNSRRCRPRCADLLLSTHGA